MNKQYIFDSEDYINSFNSYSKLPRNEIVDMVKKYLDPESGSELSLYLDERSLGKLNKYTLTSIVCVESSKVITSDLRSSLYGLLGSLCGKCKTESKTPLNNVRFLYFEDQKKSGIPRAFFNADIMKCDKNYFEMLVNIINPKTKYFWQFPQNLGEDINSYIMSAMANYILANHSGTVRFVSFGDYYIYTNDYTQANDYILKLRVPKFLFIDGIDIEKMSEFKRLALHNLIKWRRQNRKKTIVSYTSDMFNKNHFNKKSVFNDECNLINITD